MSSEYKVVYVANGQLEADMVRLMLEAHGLNPITRGESAGAVYGLTIGSLGEVSVYVPDDQFEMAAHWIELMEKGELEEKGSTDASQENPEE